MLSWLKTTKPRHQSDNQSDKNSDNYSQDKRRLLKQDQEITGWFLSESKEICPGFRIESDDVVADIGCGDGAYAEFAAKCGAELLATDIDPQKVEATKRRLNKYEAQAFRAEVSNSDPLPFADGVATKVICREVLEHVDDPTRILAELVRIGRPGAQYLLSVPDPVAETIQKSIAPPEYWEKPNHLRVFSRPDFEDMVQSAGLNLERRQNGSFYWSMYWILFWAAEQEFGKPDTPILRHWTRTWEALLSSPKHEHIKKTLDEFMPKSQAIIARKAA